MPTIAIVDYGMGNLHSIAKAFQYAAPDQQVLITRDAAEIAAAERVVLPGQAAMPESMAALNASGLRGALDEAVRSKPFFGVCLGLQMLFPHSDEGDVSALGWWSGRVRRFPQAHRDESGLSLKIPHMGWNNVHFPNAMKNHPCWAGIVEGTVFYFAHSYYAVPDDAAFVAGFANYPSPICVAAARGNIFAVQFHPEKSAAAGLQVLRNFSVWDGSF